MQGIDKASKMNVTIVERDGQEKTYRISKRAFTAAIALFYIVLIGMIGIIVKGGLGVNQEELEALRAKNIQQQEQINVLAQKANALQADVNRIHSLEAEMRQLTNTATEPVSRSGIDRSMASTAGRLVAPTLDEVTNRMEAISYNLQTSERNLQQIHENLLAVQTRPSGIPADGDFSSRFGWRWGRLHAGVDIANDVGTPIYSTAAGTIVMSEWHGAYGYCVKIDHGNGMETLYGHCSELLVDEGQRVRKGEMIALMGNTGRSTGPHVHYEVYVDGEVVNPAHYL